MKTKGDDNIYDISKIKAAMFVPYTGGSALAKVLRDIEYDMEKLYGHRLKIVEHPGLKLEDILTQSNPWKGQQCGRENCLLCETKRYTGKNKTQDCTKRSVVYQTYCITCEEREAVKIDDNENLTEKEKKEMKAKIRRYKYIGETSRSTFERAREHLADMDQLKPGSNLLKHLIEIHETEEKEIVKFGIRVVKFTKSSFERQIMESVVIQQERAKHNLLNSRAEYNRCAIPRITTKIGDTNYKRYEKEIEQEKEKEEKLEEKIRQMRKTRNKGRRKYPNQKEQPSNKRRMVGDEGRPDRSWQEWGRPEKEKRERWKEI
jgi:hypothetical protein